MTDAAMSERTGRARGLVDLRAATSPSEVGGKAAPLARAMAAGLHVPPGFVVPPDASFDAASLREALASVGPGPYAVRSSAVDEDSAARSFAGQLETILDVAGHDVPRAIERCRGSARAMRVLRYAGSPGAVAVIVQQMVRAEQAGVAFSADPRTGTRGVVVIEAVRGLGDRLVGGEVTPEQWRVGAAIAERVTGVQTGEASVLDAELARRIAQLARELERLFGAPQDVEWAFARGELHVLQSRPITALPAAPIPLEVVAPEGDWQRDDHHGALSPLGWSWFAPYPVAMAKEMAAIMPIREMRTKNVGGQLYMQMVMEGGGDGPLPPRWVLWLVSRILPSLRRANRHCEALLDRETYMEAIEAWERTGRAALAAETDALFTREPRGLSDAELLARIERALAHTAKGLSLHAAFGAQWMFPLGKLVLFVEDELGWHGNRAMELVAGSSDKTTELHRSIESVLDGIDDALGGGAFPHTWGELFDRVPEHAAKLADWLEANRLRMMHYDPRHSMLGERPDVVLAIAQSIVEARRSRSELATPPDASPSLAEAEERLAPDRFAELERLLVHARRGYALRDDNGIETVSRPAGLLRWYVLELGRRVGLEAPEHGVYLTVQEHAPALRREIPDLRERVARRRGEESWALQHRGPLLYGKPPPPMPALDAFPSGLCRVMRMFAWMMKAEEMPEPTKEGALKGIGIGTRVVTARARVIDHPEELASLRHGEVMVCRITSPEWSVALGRVAAIVTDEGALLSHPAVIAREYGVTAVVGCGLATRRIRTGERVRVDPIDGTVTVAS